MGNDRYAVSNSVINEELSLLRSAKNELKGLYSDIAFIERKCIVINSNAEAIQSILKQFGKNVQKFEYASKLLTIKVDKDCTIDDIKSLIEEIKAYTRSVKKDAKNDYKKKASTGSSSGGGSSAVATGGASAYTSHKKKKHKKKHKKSNAKKTKHGHLKTTNVKLPGSPGPTAAVVVPAVSSGAWPKTVEVTGAEDENEVVPTEEENNVETTDVPDSNEELNNVDEQTTDTDSTDVGSDENVDTGDQVEDNVDNTDTGDTVEQDEGTDTDAVTTDDTSETNESDASARYSEESGEVYTPEETSKSGNVSQLGKGMIIPGIAGIGAAGVIGRKKKNSKSENKYKAKTTAEINNLLLDEEEQVKIEDEFQDDFYE